MRRSLPYHDLLSCQLRAFAKPEDRAIWLKLGNTQQELFCAHPAHTLYLAALGNGHRDDLDVFWQALARLSTLLTEQPSEPSSKEQSAYASLSDLPFRGGLVGYLGYDNHSHGVTHTRAQQQATQFTTLSTFPAAFMGLYPHFIVIDHEREAAEEVILPGFEAASVKWSAFLNNALKPPRHKAAFKLASSFSPLTTPVLYRQHFEQIQRYLHSGDCYQVNYAQAFQAKCEGSSATAMAHLLRASNAAYAAWVSLPEGDVLSLSPELFLQVEAGHITTKPIKGTAARDSDPLRDARNKTALQASAKNQAENLMIVDLLRHDISQHAETGSVQVKALFEVESLSQVHHLVSTITANLKENSQSIDLIKDCFPGGSITGAPKKRAMEIIAELEPTPRSVYCGSIGFINADGDACMNIAIRTLLRVNDEIYTWAGGGIVADSNCNEEYQECFDKIGALMKVLENLR
jgi:para-aminobenzoate synthetase component 1